MGGNSSSKYAVRMTSPTANPLASASPSLRTNRRPCVCVCVCVCVCARARVCAIVHVCVRTREHVCARVHDLPIAGPLVSLLAYDQPDLCACVCKALCVFVFVSV